VIDAVTSKRNKRQEENVAVYAVKPSSAAVSLLGTFVEQQAKRRHNIVGFDARDNALHYAASNECTRN